MLKLIFLTVKYINAQIQIQIHRCIFVAVPGIPNLCYPSLLKISFYQRRISCLRHNQPNISQYIFEDAKSDIILGLLD